MESPNPSATYLSDSFVTSAGSILFRKAPDTNKLQICILYERRKGEWLLPKGRKDCGESIEAAALRETFEETGYACSLIPLRMPTRATAPGLDAPGPDDYALERGTRVVEGATEPIAVQVRQVGPTVLKIIWWYATWVTTGDKSEGTQMATEAFDSHFLDAEEALARLSFRQDREVVAQALALVLDTENERALSSS